MKLEDLGRELALHRQSTIQAIESGRTDVAVRRLQAYVKFAEAFFDAAPKGGSEFSRQGEPVQDTLVYSVLPQISSHAREVVTAAIRSGNRELALTARAIPAQIMHLSVSKQSALLYQDMLQVYPRILALSYNPALLAVKDAIALSWYYITDSVFYWPFNGTREVEIRPASFYVSEMLWAFCDMLKVAMDHSDSDAFSVMARGFTRLHSNLEYRIAKSDALMALKSIIDTEQALIWFGLGAWVVRSHNLSGQQPPQGWPDQKLVDASQIGNFLDVIAPQFQTIGKLSATYSEAMQRHYGQSTWRQWIWETLPMEVVHHLDFERWLTWFYCLVGLRRSTSVNPSDSVKPHRELRHRMEDIEKAVQEVRQNPPDRSEITDEQAAENFLNAHRLAVRRWDFDREEAVISMPLAQSRIDAFAEECLKEWQEQGWLVNLFRQRGQLQTGVAESETGYRGIPSYMPKDAFIEAPGAMYLDLGRSFGIGRGINEMLLAEIEAACAVRDEVSRDAIAEKVLGSISPSPGQIVVVFGGVDLQFQFFEHDQFTPHWQDPDPAIQGGLYLGRFGDTSVFAHYAETEERVMVINVPELGNLIQYEPQDDNRQGLLVRITAINGAEAEELYKQDPEAIKGQDGATLAPEEARRQLQLRVKVWVAAWLEFETESSAPGFVIPVAKP